MKTAASPTERFTGKAFDYAQFRPGYAPAFIQYLKDDWALSAESAVADIGSGTGTSSKILLDLGCRVYAVEPNDDMRAYAELMLSDHPRFTSVRGTAEDTTLAADSVDMIFAAQAFHWFARTEAREEFLKILRPEGVFVLVWNERRPGSSAFMDDYDRLLDKFGTDYGRVKHTNISKGEIYEFFGTPEVKEGWLENFDYITREQFLGRARSQSFMPMESHLDFAAVKSQLEQAFRQYEREGKVHFLYYTHFFVGRMLG